MRIQNIQRLLSICRKCKVNKFDLLANVISILYIEQKRKETKFISNIELLIGYAW